MAPTLHLLRRRRRAAHGPPSAARRRGLRRSCRPRWRAVSRTDRLPTRSPSAWRDRCRQASPLPDRRSSRRRESLAPACLVEIRPLSRILEQRPDALRRIFDRPGGVDRRKARARRRPILHPREIERFDVAGRLLLVEAAAGLGTGPATPDQLVDDGRNRKGGLLCGIEPLPEVRATAARMSTPARSIVRNVALFGRPIAGPVIASTSSTPRPAALIALNTCIRPKMPIRLAMKPGVSFARTTPLPSRLSANSTIVRTTADRCRQWRSPRAAPGSAAD